MCSLLAPSWNLGQYCCEFSPSFLPSCASGPQLGRHLQSQNSAFIYRWCPCCTTNSNTYSTNCCKEENAKLRFLGTFPTGTASRNPFLLESKVLCENKKGILLHFGLRPLLATVVTTGLGISPLWQSLKGQARASLWPGGLPDGAPGRLLKIKTQTEVRHMTRHF